MAMHRIGADEAFTRLSEISQRTNTKVHAVARHLMAEFADPDHPPPL